jgi:stage IV sporulation protein B
MNGFSIDLPLGLKGVGFMEGTVRKKKFCKAVIVFSLVISIISASGASNVNAVFSSKGGHLLVPMGNTVGIKLKSDGVLVVGLSQVEGGTFGPTPAASAGIRAGDIITQLNAKKIESVEDFRSAVKSLGEKPATVRVRRNGKDHQMTVVPVRNKNGESELGVWLRDGIVGIGTVTFYDADKKIFGALGHSVNDIDTGIVLPLKSGSIMKSNIVSVIKGANGSPGELRGSFDLLSSIGRLYANTPKGIFGTLEQSKGMALREAIPAAKRNEIKTGKATILSNISGDSVEEFEIEISRIYPPGENGVRDMMITVTDENLIDRTGGIVQGMSGSPIIQNGKLVGAVTHVLVNDPCRGYAIAIENMIEAAFTRNAASIIFSA